MAGRGGPKLKEYRSHITSVRHWLKEIEFDGLIVCEVYCAGFGNCSVILPTINNVMLGIDDAEDKVKWLVVNTNKQINIRCKYNKSTTTSSSSSNMITFIPFYLPLSILIRSFNDFPSLFQFFLFFFLPFFVC